MAPDEREAVRTSAADFRAAIRYDAPSAPPAVPAGALVTTWNAPRTPPRRAPAPGRPAFSFRAASAPP
jgi:hypothetical protein